MFSFTPENGTGLTNANSYASVAECDDYHAGHLFAASWTGASSGTKEKALVLATLVIDAHVRFFGTKLKQEQALQWPRENCPDRDSEENGSPAVLPSDAVPKGVKDATCEMARELITTDRTVTEGEGIANVVITGAVHVQFNPRDRRPILSRLAIALLSKYGIILGTSGAVPVTRS